MLLKRATLCWFDLLVDKRIATLRSNVFVGVNAGNKFFKVGFLCLIGIAHLPEQYLKVHYHKRFELRPTLTTNIRSMIDEELLGTPPDLLSIFKKLFHAVKLITFRVLPNVEATSNVVCEDGILRANRINTFFKAGDIDMIDEEVEEEEIKKPAVISFLKENEQGDKLMFLDIVKR